MVKAPKIILALTSALLLAACGNSYNKADMNTEEFLAMDTYISLSAYGENAEVALANARREIKSVESQLSVTDPASEVSRINESGGEDTVLSEGSRAKRA